MTVRKLPLTLVLVTGIAAGGAAPSVAAAGPASPGGTAAVAALTEVVVKLQPGASITAVNSTYRTRTVEPLLGSRAIFLLAVPPGTSAEALAERMSGDARLVYAEPNYREAAPEGNPTYKWGDGRPQWLGTDPAPWRSQSAYTQVRLSGAHARSTGAGTLVAVLDTGVQPDHPSLRARLASGGYDFVDDDSSPAEQRNGVDDDRDGRTDDGFGHGTHVAGIIAAVAPGARILPVRVLDDEGHGEIFTTAEGIQHAIAAGADVINLSLGGRADSELLEDIIGDDPDDQEAVVVAAAGNDGATAPQYPAATEGVIGVAAVNATDARAPFSNSGPWVGVAAPGVGIASTFPRNGYARWNGTSMATPFVAGQAALLQAQDPARGPGDIAFLIRSTAKPVGTGLGAGRIDVAASVSR